jgi:homoserine kinase
VVDSSANPPTAIRFNVPRDLKVVLFIPELRLSTADMREVLPKKVPLEDAVTNLGRLAIGVAGIASGSYEHLGALTQDRIHEPYRAAVYPQFPALIEAAREAGALGACLSGAGSTVIAFSDALATLSRIEGAFSAVAADLDLPGRVAIAAPRNAGAHVRAHT